MTGIIKLLTQLQECICNPATFNESIKKKWKENNDKMNAEGVDNFYIEQKAKSRY